MLLGEERTLNFSTYKGHSINQRLVSERRCVACLEKQIAYSGKFTKGFIFENVQAFFKNILSKYLQ